MFDNLSTGFRDNVPGDAELLEGDIRDEAAVRAAVTGVDVVFHHAAHRAVLQSVENPLSTDLANTHGTLLVLKAAQDAGVRRVVAASSSSVYGGAEQLPTPESAPLAPRSPYAVSKLAGEHYCRVWSELFGLETVALRYFNVYGPRQRPDSAYAAVIPLFTEALRTGARPIVHGDGLQSRSFAYVDDVVDANLAAAAAPAEACYGQGVQHRREQQLHPARSCSTSSAQSSASRWTRSTPLPELATSATAPPTSRPLPATWAGGRR